MHPVLFRIGSYPVNTYGVMIAIGFVLAVLLIRKEAIRRGWPKELVVDYCFYALFIGFLGSRLFFVITQASYFAQHPLEIFYIWEGGLVFYGGPAIVVPWTIWWTRRHKINIFQFGDVAVQGLTLAHAFGRFGCLGAGCCHGKVCDLPWAVRLHSDLVPESLRGLPLHPTQLYESGLLLILFGILRWRNRSPRFSGEIMLIYFMGYAVLRSIVEIYRGDSIRGFVIQDVLSTSQFIALIFFVIAALIYVRQWRKTGSGSK